MSGFFRVLLTILHIIVIQQVLGPEHVDVATTYNNLGCAYDNRGDFTTALTMYDKDLTIMLKELGPEHIDVAAIYNKMGIANHSNGNYDNAIVLYNKALVIRLDKLGPENAEIAESLNNLGEAHRNQGSVHFLSLRHPLSVYAHLYLYL